MSKGRSRTEPASDEGRSDAAPTEPVLADQAEAGREAGREAGLEAVPEEPQTGSVPLGEPGAPLSRHSPFYIGFFGGLGALLAYWIAQQLAAVGSIIVLIVVAMFLAAGLNPPVEALMRRGLKRSWSVLVVIAVVLLTLALFVAAIVPVISDQVALITRNAPGWLDRLREHPTVQEWNQQYDLIDRASEYIRQGDWAGGLFGGVLGVGFAVLSALANTFIVVVLMLYFLASLPRTKAALYRLAPASRRTRVTLLGDQVLRSVGGYISGAFVVAVCAGLTSLVFLFIVGMGEYAVALSFVVALLSLVPMVGATISMVIVSAIGLTVSPTTALICLVFYLAYQQLENYVIYPKVMARSVDIPGSMTVIAALFGGALLGVVGALMAVPTAAALLMLTREVVIRRQDAK